MILGILLRIDISTKVGVHSAVQFRFETSFRTVFEFPRDEFQLSVRCFLVVPDRARLSRLCWGRLRSYSRRVESWRGVPLLWFFAKIIVLTSQVSTRIILLTYKCIPGTGLSPGKRWLHLFFLFSFFTLFFFIFCGRLVVDFDIFIGFS